MGFTAPLVFTPARAAGGAGNNALVVTAGDLLGLVGAPDPTGAAADSGLISSNNGAIDAVPPNTESLPPAFGPGQDNWSAEDVLALKYAWSDVAPLPSNVSCSFALVANVNPAPAGANITNANVVILVHSRGAPTAGLRQEIDLKHSLVK